METCSGCGDVLENGRQAVEVERSKFYCLDMCAVYLRVGEISDISSRQLSLVV